MRRVLLGFALSIVAAPASAAPPAPCPTSAALSTYLVPGFSCTFDRVVLDFATATSPEISLADILVELGNVDGKKRIRFVPSSAIFLDFATTFSFFTYGGHIAFFEYFDALEVSEYITPRRGTFPDGTPDYGDYEEFFLAGSRTLAMCGEGFSMGLEGKTEILADESGVKHWYEDFSDTGLHGSGVDRCRRGSPDLWIAGSRGGMIPPRLTDWSVDLAFVTTPEPATIVLLGGGLVLVGLARWRRRR